MNWTANEKGVDIASENAITVRKNVDISFKATLENCAPNRCKTIYKKPIFTVTSVFSSNDCLPFIEKSWWFQDPIHQPPLRVRHLGRCVIYCVHIRTDCNGQIANHRGLSFMAHENPLVCYSILNDAESSITKTKNDIDLIQRRETRKADRNERDIIKLWRGGDVMEGTVDRHNCSAC